MNIDLGQVPKWIFAVAALILVAILFYALIWPGVPVTLGSLGTFGRVETTSLTTNEIASLKSLLGRLILAPSGATCFDNPNLQFKFCFETDGNLVGYDKSKKSSATPNGTPIWGMMKK